MSTIDSMTPSWSRRSQSSVTPRTGNALSDPACAAGARRSAGFRNGGLSRLLFLLPLLLIFGAFSWYPIVRLVLMSFQHTNEVITTWVGFQNFSEVLHDPLFPIAVRNTLEFAGLALIFGYPIPLVAAVLMSEVRKRRGLYAALAYLPVVIPPVVAVLLWKTFYDGGPTGVFNTILGWVGIGPQPWIQSTTQAMPSLVLESTWANAGGTIIIYLAALDQRQPRALRGGIGRRRGALEEDLARDAAADAHRAAGDDDPPDHRDRAGLPRAISVHLGWPRQRDADGAAVDLQLRLRQLARRLLR